MFYTQNTKKIQNNLKSLKKKKKIIAKIAKYIFIHFIQSSTFKI